MALKSAYRNFNDAPVVQFPSTQGWTQICVQGTATYRSRLAQGKHLGQQSPILERTPWQSEFESKVTKSLDDFAPQRGVHLSGFKSDSEKSIRWYNPVLAFRIKSLAATNFASSASGSQTRSSGTSESDSDEVELGVRTPIWCLNPSVSTKGLLALTF